MYLVSNCSYLAVLVVKCRALCILSKYSTAELYSWLSFIYVYFDMLRFEPMPTCLLGKFLTSGIHNAVSPDHQQSLLASVVSFLPFFTHLQGHF